MEERGYIGRKNNKDKWPDEIPPEKKGEKIARWMKQGNNGDGEKEEIVIVAVYIYIYGSKRREQCGSNVCI